MAGGMPTSTNSEETAQPARKAYRGKLAELVACDRRGEAVALFMRFAEVRQAPMWSMLEAVAPTLTYDAGAIGEDRSAPVERAASIRAPVLVIDSGANLTMMPFMHASATALAKAHSPCAVAYIGRPDSRCKQEVLAPVLVEFFSQ
jgi:hypothetical protein